MFREKSFGEQLQIGAGFPGQLLTIVIWQDVKEKMGFNAAQEKYIGGKAVVTGKIELYKGKSQIVITHPSQFNILYDEEIRQPELSKEVHCDKQTVLKCLYLLLIT